MSSKYQIVESVGNQLLPVVSYESLRIHHPSANAHGLATGVEADFERPTANNTYPVVQGEHEEVRTMNGNQYVKKDMIFLENGSGNTQVPAPVQGYVYFDRSYGQANIYDKPKDEGGELIARVFHMKPDTFKAESGSYIDYGQPLGVQGQTGANGQPDPAHFGIHAHIEFHKDHLEQFDRFIKDVNSGVIAPNKYPAQSQPIPFSSPQDYGSLNAPASSPALNPAVQTHLANAETMTRQLYAEKGFNYEKQNGEACAIGIAKLAADKNIIPIEFISSTDSMIHIGHRNAQNLTQAASASSTQLMSTTREEAISSTLAAVAPTHNVAMNNPAQDLSQTPDAPSKGRSI